MQPFIIKTPSGRFYVKPAGTPGHEIYSVVIDGEEITMEKDDDGYLRAQGATSKGHRLHISLLNMIADYIKHATD